jgi:hypothetical protein
MNIIYSPYTHFVCCCLCSLFRLEDLSLKWIYIYNISDMLTDSVYESVDRFVQCSGFQIADFILTEIDQYIFYTVNVDCSGNSRPCTVSTRKFISSYKLIFLTKTFGNIDSASSFKLWSAVLNLILPHWTERSLSEIIKNYHVYW